MVHDPSSQAVRALSSALFGAQYRLEICGALHSGSVITATELAQRLRMAPSKSCIKMEIDRLVDAGLLVRRPREPGSRLAPLEVRTSPLWNAAREIVRDLEEDRPQGDSDG